MHQVDGGDAPHRPRGAQQVPRVVEDGGGERQDDRVEPGEVVRLQGPVDVGAGVPRGEGGHGHAMGRE